MQDFPIYDSDDQPPVLKTSEFPEMPIFSNFPMMGPNEFMDLVPDEEQPAQVSFKLF